MPARSSAPEDRNLNPLHSLVQGLALNRYGVGGEWTEWGLGVQGWIRHNSIPSANSPLPLCPYLHRVAIQIHCIKSRDDGFNALSWPFLFFFNFFLFRATPSAYGGSQARSLIGATAAGLCQSHSNTGSERCLWLNTTAHGNAGSLTHWAEPGIEPTTSWLLVKFVSAAPWWELPELSIVSCRCLW